ncbi:MAG: GNAT family N-acetyltransferase [Crocinitomicaceae bacterium]
MKTIETSRLILRPFTIEDAEGSYEMSQDPEVMKFLGGIDTGTVEEHREMIRKAPMGDYEKYGFGRHAVIHKETGEYMGFNGLKYIVELDEVDIGWRLKSKFWRQGYAYESALPCIAFAFNDLGLDRIVSMADVDNVASTELMKKLGMTYEKDIHIYDEDAVYHSLTKSDWIKMNG